MSQDFAPARTGQSRAYQQALLRTVGVLISTRGYHTGDVGGVWYAGSLTPAVCWKNLAVGDFCISVTPIPAKASQYI